MESLAELKEYLKIFVKEKEQAYRVKIERKLYGRHYSGGGSQRESSGGGASGGLGLQGDRKKRTRDEYEEDDDEDYIEGKRKSGQRRAVNGGMPKRRHT